MNLHYKLKSNFFLNYSFTANDGISSSEAQTVLIRYCYCANGECDDFGVLRDGEDAESSFALVECTCETGYEGIGVRFSLILWHIQFNL